jgi:transposase
LSNKQLKELKEFLSNPDDNHSIHEVQIIIKEKFNVKYYYKQVWEIVRKKFGLNYQGVPFM